MAIHAMCECRGDRLVLVLLECTACYDKEKELYIISQLLHNYDIVVLQYQSRSHHLVTIFVW